MSDKGIFFVCRSKSNVKARIVEHLEVDQSTGLTSDQTKELTGILCFEGLPDTTATSRVLGCQNWEALCICDQKFKLSPLSNCKDL